jgi:hypothetical protein
MIGSWVQVVFDIGSENKRLSSLFWYEDAYETHQCNVL